MTLTEVDMDEITECPLCSNEPDLQDRHFRPCTCPYWICMFCYDRICKGSRPVCPNCQQPYTDDTRTMTKPTAEEIEADKRRRKEKKTANKLSNSNKTRKPSDKLRIVERTIVHVTPIPDRLDDKSLHLMLSRYGKITRLNRPKGKSTSVLVTYSRPEEARNAILQLDERTLGDSMVRAMYGLSRYCAAFIADTACNNQHCGFRHEQASDDIVFTEDEVKEGKHFDQFGTSAVRREHEASLQQAAERVRPQQDHSSAPETHGHHHAHAAPPSSAASGVGSMSAASREADAPVPDSWEQHDATEDEQRASGARPIRRPPGYESAAFESSSPLPQAFLESYDYDNTHDINQALFEDSTPVELPTSIEREPLDTRYSDLNGDLDEVVQLMLDPHSSAPPTNRSLGGSRLLSNSFQPPAQSPAAIMQSAVDKLLAGNDQDAVAEIEMSDVHPQHIAITLDRTRCNLLHYAILTDNAFLARYSLDKDLDPNMPDSAGFPSLHLCVLKARRDLLQLLLEQPKIDINSRCSDKGQTPLHLAIRQGNFEMVSMLLEADASLLECDDRGLSPLQVARELYQNNPADQVREMVAQLQQVAESLPGGGDHSGASASGDYEPTAVPSRTSLWADDSFVVPLASDSNDSSRAAAGHDNDDAESTQSTSVFSPILTPTSLYLPMTPGPASSSTAAGRGRGSTSPPSSASFGIATSQPPPPQTTAAATAQAASIGAGRGRGRGKTVAGNVAPANVAAPADEWLLLSQDALPDAARSGIQASSRTMIQSVENPITAPKVLYAMPLKPADLAKLTEDVKKSDYPKEFDKFRTFALFSLYITDRGSVERLWEAVTGTSCPTLASSDAPPRPVPLGVASRSLSSGALARPPVPTPIGRPTSTAAAASAGAPQEPPAWLAPPAAPAPSRGPSTCSVCGKVFVLASLMEMHRKKHENDAARGTSNTPILPTRPSKTEKNDNSKVFARAMEIIEKQKAVPEEKAQFIAMAKRVIPGPIQDAEFYEVLHMTYRKQKDLKSERMRQGGSGSSSSSAVRRTASSGSSASSSSSASAAAAASKDRQGHKPSVLTPSGRRYCYFYQLGSCSAAACSFAHEKDANFVVGKKY